MKLKGQVAEIFRDGDGVAAWLENFNPERVVETWLVSFEQAITGLRLDQPHRSKVKRDAVGAWLARIDPRDIECRADHEDDEVGTWFKFRRLDSGLLSAMQVDDGEEGDQLLHVLDNDPSWGFSFQAKPVGSTHIERDEHGEPFDVFDSLDIIEAGPSPSPADPMAYVVRIAGKPPKWMARMDAMERHKLLLDRGILAASPGRSGWHAVWGR